MPLLERARRARLATRRAGHQASWNSDHSTCSTSGYSSAISRAFRAHAGIVTLIEVAAKDYNDVLSGCRARAIPHIEDVSPNSFERGSVE